MLCCSVGCSGPVYETHGYEDADPAKCQQGDTVAECVDENTQARGDEGAYSSQQLNTGVV